MESRVIEVNSPKIHWTRRVRRIASSIQALALEQAFVLSSNAVLSLDVFTHVT